MQTDVSLLGLGTVLCDSISHGLEPDVVLIVRAIARASAEVAEKLQGAPLDLTPSRDSGRQVMNAAGDLQHPLDVVAHDVCLAALRSTPVQSVLSEEAAEPIVIKTGATLAVAIDPLDGSGNIATNAPLGTIFSIIRSCSPDDPAGAFLQSGRQVCAAGLVMYGPATVMALSVGRGTDLFALDRQAGDFIRVQAGLVIPPGTREFAINASNYRHWEPRLRTYIDDLVAGANGPRGEDFNMRWIGALVAEAYRILLRGGIFLYPSDARKGYRNGRLRLLYEAQPIAFLVEQAGGAAIDMTGPILDRQPSDFHERCPLMFGSRDKIGRVAEYLAASQFTGERSPLFASRGLFRS